MANETMDGPIGIDEWMQQRYNRQKTFDATIWNSLLWWNTCEIIGKFVYNVAISIWLGVLLQCSNICQRFEIYWRVDKFGALWLNCNT